LIRKLGLMSLPFLAAAIVGLAFLPAAGCSGEQGASDSSADEPFSEAELADMRKSVKTPSEFRELKKIKLAERAGAAVVKTKSTAGKPAPR
jgi:hypothetical protein